MVKLIFFNDNGIYDATNYYNKSKNVDELAYQIEQKRNDISNLNYELNSINNNINYTQKLMGKKLVSLIKMKE